MSNEPLSVDSMEASAVTRLLRMGLSPARRPIDALIDRLRARDGESWLDLQLGVEMPQTERMIASRILARQAQLDDLLRMKDLSKLRLAQVHTEPERVSALLGYFLAVAGGLAQYGLVITSRAGEELEIAMLDLAEAAPRALQDVAAEAAMRASATHGR